MKYELFKKIEELYVRSVLRDYKHPYDLAAVLENIANDAWDELDDHCQLLVYPKPPNQSYDLARYDLKPGDELGDYPNSMLP